MSDTRPEIHVGDIGTLYQVRVYDDLGEFDPTSATTKQLIFRLPGGNVLAKDATVVPVGSPATAWYLTYRVTAGAGAGSPPADFHAAPGPVKIQIYLQLLDGSMFYSDVRTTDEDGRELRIYPNLDA